MNNNNKEIRSINNSFESNGRVVSGYAIRFNEESVNMGFVEIIRPEALTREQVEDSDIFAFYNHNPEHVLARNGKADTLKLDLREDGLYYEFEAPNTSIGDELLEHIKRNEMYGTSFAFSMNADGDGETWTLREDGTIYREITSIEMLYEISPVFSPAYPTTSVSARSLEMINKLTNNDMNEENKQLRNDEEKPVDEQEMKNEETVEETVEEQEQKSCDEDLKDDENRAEEEETDETPEDEDKNKQNNETNSSDEDNSDEDEENNKNIEKNSHSTMEKKFSLLKAIRTVANGQQFDEATQAVINMGAENLRNSGIAFNGQIQIPVGAKNEERSAITVTAEGTDVVVTDFLDILAPLHDNLVFERAGARFLDGLVGDVQIPSMTAENVGWVGEVSSASDGAGSFSNIKLQPKRLSAYIDVSKQFLVQDSLSAENLIRSELVNAIALKLQSTILGTAAGSSTTPAGLGYNVSPTEISDFKGLCEFEATLESANFWNAGRYILSPSAKAALRSMPKGNVATRLVLDTDNIDGVPYDVCNAVTSDCLYYGDWSQLAIGSWGSLDLVVDPYTKAADGQVRIVINAFFDAKLQRPNAIKYGKVVEPEE